MTPNKKRSPKSKRRKKIEKQPKKIHKNKNSSPKSETSSSTSDSNKSVLGPDSTGENVTSTPDKIKSKLKKTKRTQQLSSSDADSPLDADSPSPQKKPKKSKKHSSSQFSSPGQGLKRTALGVATKEKQWIPVFNAIWSKSKELTAADFLAFYAEHLKTKHRPLAYSKVEHSRDPLIRSILFINKEYEKLLPTKRPIKVWFGNENVQMDDVDIIPPYMERYLSGEIRTVQMKVEDRDSWAEEVTPIVLKQVVDLISSMPQDEYKQFYEKNRAVLFRGLYCDSDMRSMNVQLLRYPSTMQAELMSLTTFKAKIKSNQTVIYLSDSYYIPTGSKRHALIVPKDDAKALNEFFPKFEGLDIRILESDEARFLSWLRTLFSDYAWIDDVKLKPDQSEFWKLYKISEQEEEEEKWIVLIGQHTKPFKTMMDLSVRNADFAAGWAKTVLWTLADAKGWKGDSEAKYLLSKVPELIADALSLKDEFGLDQNDVAGLCNTLIGEQSFSTNIAAGSNMSSTPAPKPKQRKPEKEKDSILTTDFEGNKIDETSHHRVGSKPIKISLYDSAIQDCKVMAPMLKELQRSKRDDDGLVKGKHFFKALELCYDQVKKARFSDEILIKIIRQIEGGCIADVEGQLQPEQLGSRGHGRGLDGKKNSKEVAKVRQNPDGDDSDECDTSQSDQLNDDDVWKAFELHLTKPAGWNWRGVKGRQLAKWLKQKGEKIMIHQDKSISQADVPQVLLRLDPIRYKALKKKYEK